MEGGLLLVSIVGSVDLIRLVSKSYWVVGLILSLSVDDGLGDEIRRRSGLELRVRFGRLKSCRGSKRLLILIYSWRDIRLLLRLAVLILLHDVLSCATNWHLLKLYGRRCTTIVIIREIIVLIYRYYIALRNNSLHLSLLIDMD